MQNYDALKNVFGYDAIKKELTMIGSWFMDDSVLNDKRLTLVKGILFYGKPGCGKTKMMKEFSDSLGYPVFSISGKEKNSGEEISDVFVEARLSDKAVVLIDEIDLLINGDQSISRILQSELDGLVDNGRILVLASTNSLPFLKSPLCRNGRFDRKILIGPPDTKTREQIFESFLKSLGIDPTTINLEYLSKITSGITGADIKLIVNDAYLRCRDTLGTYDLEESYNRIIHESWMEENDIERSYSVAVHEASHSVMVLKYEEFFTFHFAKFERDGGVTKVYDTKENHASLDKEFAQLAIGVAGYIGEEVFLKRKDIGSSSDMAKVRRIGERIVQHCGIYDSSDFIPVWENGMDRVESEKKRRRLERKADRLIHSMERQVRRYIKSNKQLVSSVAAFLMKNGVIRREDLINLHLGIGGKRKSCRTKLKLLKTTL